MSGRQRSYHQNELIQETIDKLVDAVENQSGLKVCGLVTVALGQDENDKPVPILIKNITPQDDKFGTFMVISNFIKSHAEELNHGKHGPTDPA